MILKNIPWPHTNMYMRNAQFINLFCNYLKMVIALNNFILSSCDYIFLHEFADKIQKFSNKFNAFYTITEFFLFLLLDIFNMHIFA